MEEVLYSIGDGRREAKNQRTKEPKSLGCWNAVLNNNENIKAKMLKA